jgi:predicted MPP superfamily phosphohydrolase
VTPDDEDSYQFTPEQSSWFRMHLRPVINSLGGAVMTAATLGYARFIAPFKTEYVEVAMPLANLPASFEGFRILQLSDFHTGDVPVAYLKRVIARVNEMRYDLVVFTGDFVSHSLKHVQEAVDVLAELRRPLAVVFGNHDYSSTIETWSSSEVAEALTRGLEARGIDVLRNRALAIAHDDGRLHIVGLEDFWSGKFSAEKAFAGIDRNEPIVALSHNADSVFTLRRFGAQWVLAGHTHGGQIRLPILGAMVLPVHFKQFDRGLFDVRGTKLYVSRGVGCRVPVRFRCRPEVTTFVLRRG